MVVINYIEMINIRSISANSDIAEFNALKTATNAMNYLYQDTTIEKASTNRTKADRMIEVVRNKQRKLKSQREVRKITQIRREVQENWEEFIRLEVSAHHKKKIYAEIAALKIQRIARGFLVRIKIEPLLLELREHISSRIVKELRIQTDFCMLSLGSNTIPVTLYLGY